MGANDYMYTGVQRDAAATVSKRQPYCVLINYVASSLFVYVATTLTILRRPIEACYVGKVFFKNKANVASGERSRVS